MQTNNEKKNPFYPLFVVKHFLLVEIVFVQLVRAVCTCSLLFTLAEVTQTACTSIKCAWSRPATGSNATFSRELDFRVASQEGYFLYNGPKPPITTLLDS